MQRGKGMSEHDIMQRRYRRGEGFWRDKQRTILPNCVLLSRTSLPIPTVICSQSAKSLSLVDIIIIQTEHHIPSAEHTVRGGHPLSSA
jgi:hypothetical protein